MASAQPARTCVGCRETVAKRSLVRVVRRSDGPKVDTAGSAAGRGAYVHARRSCLAAAFERRAFERAWRAGLAPGEAARLRTDLERLMGAV